MYWNYSTHYCQCQPPFARHHKSSSSIISVILAEWYINLFWSCLTTDVECWGSLINFFLSLLYSLRMSFFGMVFFHQQWDFYQLVLCNTKIVIRGPHFPQIGIDFSKSVQSMRCIAKYCIIQLEWIYKISTTEGKCGVLSVIQIMRSAAEGTFAHWMTGDEGDSSLGAVRRFGRLGVQEEEQARSCLAY